MLRFMQAGILAIHHQFAIVVVTKVVSLLGMTLMAGEEQAGDLWFTLRDHGATRNARTLDRGGEVFEV